MFSSLCPVCNGLENLVISCANCGNVLDDHGKLSDYYAPYSPYRPIDDLKLTNGYPDAALQQCVHIASCPSCRETSIHMIDERTTP